MSDVIKKLRWKSILIPTSLFFCLNMTDKIKTILKDIESFKTLWNDLIEIQNFRTHYEDILLVEDQVEELKKFIALKAIEQDVYDTKLSASQTIDELWQLLISFTRSYPLLCNAILPEEQDVRMLHYKPLLNSPAEKTNSEKRYTATYAAYREYYGRNPPRVVWPKPVNSNACSANTTSIPHEVIEL